MSIPISSRLVSRREFVALASAASLLAVGPRQYAGARRATPDNGWEGFDLMFIDMMTAHHDAAIAMVEIAIARSEIPKLTELAGQIIAGQTAENEQMRAWREAWYPSAEPTTWDAMMPGSGGMMHGEQDMPHMGAFGMMGLGMMDSADAAAMLRAANPFEPAFIDAMIPHHLMALMMTEMAVQHAAHPELISLATEMFDTQTAEIALLRSWR